VEGPTTGRLQVGMFGGGSARAGSMRGEKEEEEHRAVLRRHRRVALGAPAGTDWGVCRARQPAKGRPKVAPKCPIVIGRPLCLRAGPPNATLATLWASRAARQQQLASNWPATRQTASPVAGPLPAGSSCAVWGQIAGLAGLSRRQRGRRLCIVWGPRCFEEVGRRCRRSTIDGRRARAARRPPVSPSLPPG